MKMFIQDGDKIFAGVHVRNITLQAYNETYGTLLTLFAHLGMPGFQVAWQVAWSVPVPSVDPSVPFWPARVVTSAVLTTMLLITSLP